MRGVSSRGQHRQEKDSFNAGRRAKKAVRSRQLRLPVPRRRETIGKTRCRLSFFFFFILSSPYITSLRLQADIVYCHLLRSHQQDAIFFESIFPFHVLANIIEFLFFCNEIRILAGRKMDKNKLVPLENLVRRIKRWRFTMCIIFMGNHALEQDVRQFTDS